MVTSDGIADGGKGLDLTGLYIAIIVIVGILIVSFILYKLISKKNDTAVKPDTINKEKMHCRFCGEEIENDSVYCKKCGNKVN